VERMAFSSGQSSDLRVFITSYLQSSVRNNELQSNLIYDECFELAISDVKQPMWKYGKCF
jgi:hypothetical protein